MDYTKKEIKQALSKLKSAEGKEKYLKSHDIKFTHDSFNKLVIWCKDGILEMIPIYGGRKNANY